MQPLSHLCALLLAALAVFLVFGLVRTARVLGQLSQSEATSEARLYAYVQGGAL